MAEAKESNATVLLLVLLALVGVGGGYQMILKPLRARSTELAVLEKEVQEKSDRRDDLMALLPKYNQNRKFGLPADVNFSRVQYQSLVNGLLRRAEFIPNSIQITAQNPDTKSAPALTNKDPSLTKLRFTISCKGSLLQTTTFLELFYKQPVLHAVRNISLKKSSQPKTGELDVSMTLEAVVLDQSERRSTLFPVSPSAGMLGGIIAARHFAADADPTRGSAAIAKGLAVPERDYRAVIAKNVFSGPLPPPPPVITKPDKPEIVEEPPPARGQDITPYVRLTGIIRDNDKATATVFDVYNKHDHQITLDSAGDLRVDAYYFIKDAKKRIDRTRMLVVGDEDENNLEKYLIAGVSWSDVYLQKADEAAEWRSRVAASLVGGATVPTALPPKTYRWHPGSAVADAKPMTALETLEVLGDPETLIPLAGPVPKPPVESKRPSSSRPKRPGL